MKRNFCLLIIAFLIIINSTGCFELNTNKTLFVGSNADYTKIQDAIDNASNGDTVYVNNGIYNEFLYINKSINLVGESKYNTIIKYPKFDNFNLKNIILIEKDGCSIKEFKILGEGTYSDIIGINVNSSDVNISNNIIEYNYIGIKFNDYTNKNIAFKNTITENLYGISLHQSNGNNVTHNNITLSPFYGVQIYLSEGNYVFGNNIANCWYGIKVKGSERNEIFENEIFENGIGIETCCGSGFNIIYLNIFKNNTNHANDTLYNQWDNGSIGNYWDDYIGNDFDGDGIGDRPYKISGSENFDEFPLMISERII